MTWDPEIVKKEIMEFVSEELLLTAKDLGFKTPLFGEEVLDSLNLIELIEFIEKKYSIRVLPSEIQSANFGSICSLEQFIASKARDGN